MTMQIAYARSIDELQKRKNENCTPALFEGCDIYTFFY